MWRRAAWWSALRANLPWQPLPPLTGAEWCRVIASCRDPESCSILQKLQRDHKDTLDVVKLDVTSEDSIQVFMPVILKASRLVA